METATEAWVTARLINGPKNRFELMALPNSPLERKTSFYVLRDMEDKGLITSRLRTGGDSHRWYSLA